jgi:hypothetical protein
MEARPRSYPDDIAALILRLRMMGYGDPWEAPSRTIFEASEALPARVTISDWDEIAITYSAATIGQYYYTLDSSDRESRKSAAQLAPPAARAGNTPLSVVFKLVGADMSEEALDLIIKLTTEN